MSANKVALVTGASRGIGRGVALRLGATGATVYVTGRRAADSDQRKLDRLPTLEKTAEEITARGGKGIAVYCDHSKDDDIKALFERIDKEQDGRLDILVNNAYAAVDHLIKTMGQKFWQTDDPAYAWDVVNNVGLRNHYICSAYAAKLMVPRNQGLIVNVSSAGGLSYFFNVAYGVGKEAVDRMAVDMAHELKSSNVCCLSLWPGAVKTEMIQHHIIDNDEYAGANKIKQMFASGESTEFSGMCIAAIAEDPNMMSLTGKVYTTGDLGAKYGLTDVDGTVVQSMRSVSTLLGVVGYTGVAAWIPQWVKVPGWAMSVFASKL